jgi:hypothetical protein
VNLRPFGIVIFIAILLLGYLLVPAQYMGGLPLLSLLVLAAAAALPFIASDVFSGGARSNTAQVASVGIGMAAFGVSVVAGVIAFILAAYSGLSQLAMIGMVVSVAALAGGILLTRATSQYFDERVVAQAITLPRSEIEAALATVAAGAPEGAQGAISAMLEKLRYAASDSPQMPVQVNRALLDYVNVTLPANAATGDAGQLARATGEFDRLLATRQRALIGLRSQQ